MIESLIQELRDTLHPLPEETVNEAVNGAVEFYQSCGRALAIAIYFHGCTKTQVDSALNQWEGECVQGFLDNGIIEPTALKLGRIATDILVHHAYAVSLHMSSEGGQA